MKYEKKKVKEQPRNQPPVVIISVLLIAIVSWAVAANLYAFSEVGYQPEAPSDPKSLVPATILFGMETVLYVSLSQLENFGAVVTFIFENHGWYPATVLMVISLVIAGAVGLQNLEEDFSAPPSNHRPQY